MVKKIGNLKKINFIFMMLCACFMHAIENASLHINLADLQGNTIDQVEVGVPFLTQVIAQNIDYQKQPEGFDAWHNFAVTLYGQNHASSSVNGKKTYQTIFTYIVTAEKKGTFSVTPLKIFDKQGNVISSDSLVIKVGDIAQVQHQKVKQSYVLQLDLETKTFYVGQKISALLKFGYTEPFDDLHVVESGMENIQRGYVSQIGKSGTLKIGSVEYKTQEFLMELYPTKVGTLILPIFQASFVPAFKHNQNIASMFAMVMGTGNVIQSQPRSIQVLPLPEVKGFEGVTAIGNFEGIKFTLSAQNAKVGEGIVAKMIIQGDGNLEVAKAPMLVMPEGLHYYEGNSSVKRLDNEKFSKEFEWIVQAEFAKDFIIPEQRFLYFDPIKQTYQILTSNSERLVVAGNALAKSAESEQAQEEKKQVEELSVQHEKKELQQTVTSSEWYIYLMTFQNKLESKILMWLIQFLIGLIFLFTLLLVARGFIKKLFWFETLKYRFQFFAICRKKDVQALYKLFEVLMQEYDLQMNDEQLLQCFVALGYPEEIFENWKNFVDMLLKMNFDKNQQADEVDLAFSLAKQWFVVILSCCKMQKNKRIKNQVIS